MREYETVFVVQPEISEEGRRAVADRLDEALQKSGATRFELEDWGKRKLAYEIRKFQKGHYMVLHYGHQGSVVPELERVLRLDDSVLRFLTVQVADVIEDVEKRVAEGEERERIQREKAEVRAREAEEIRARVAAEAQAEELRARAAAEAQAAQAKEAGSEAVEASEADEAEASESESADEQVAEPIDEKDKDKNDEDKNDEDKE